VASFDLMVRLGGLMQGQFPPNRKSELSLGVKGGEFRQPRCKSAALDKLDAQFRRPIVVDQRQHTVAVIHQLE
jgi:hypothetical protein